MDVCDRDDEDVVGTQVRLCGVGAGVDNDVVVGDVVHVGYRRSSTPMVVILAMVGAIIARGGGWRRRRRRRRGPGRGGVTPECAVGAWIAGEAAEMVLQDEADDKGA